MNDKSANDQIFNCLEGLFNSSANEVFKRLNFFSLDSTWIIASDYCIREKSKNNSVSSFVLIPHLGDLRILDETLKALIPKDFKHIKSLSSEFIKFINNTPIFLIGVIHDFIDPSIPVEVFKDRQKQEIATLLEAYVEANVENPSLRFAEMIKSLNLLNQYTIRKRYDWKLVADIRSIPYLCAYLATRIADNENVKNILWISDRDSILRHADKFAMKLFNESFYYILDRRGVQNNSVRINLSDSEKLAASGSFAGILRLPDYLSGILSDLDLSTGKTSKPKASEGMLNWLSDNEKILVFKIIHHNGLLESGRMLTTMKNKK